MHVQVRLAAAKAASASKKTVRPRQNNRDSPVVYASPGVVLRVGDAIADAVHGRNAGGWQSDAGLKLDVNRLCGQFRACRMMRVSLLAALCCKHWHRERRSFDANSFQESIGCICVAMQATSHT